jgi:CRISPR/Cas system CMR-associated protein Cmr1 (group 7 of RAMP superfamily)
MEDWVLFSYTVPSFSRTLEKILKKINQKIQEYKKNVNSVSENQLKLLQKTTFPDSVCPLKMRSCPSNFGDQRVDS